MPRETKDTTIAGVRYQVTQLGATTGGQVMYRLGRAFAVLMAGAAQDKIDLGALPPSDFDWLVKTLQATTKVGIVDDVTITDKLGNAEKVGSGHERMLDLGMVFDDHFAGKYPQMLEWLKFALEVNFGPLSDALGGLIRGLTGLSPSKPQPAATGSPGGSSSAAA